MVHHHKNSEHHRGNYGLMFTLWDRAFGTYKDPRDYHGHEELGIGYSPNRLALYIGLFCGPKKK